VITALSHFTSSKHLWNMFVHVCCHHLRNLHIYNVSKAKERNEFGVLHVRAYFVVPVIETTCYKQMTGSGTVNRSWLRNFCPFFTVVRSLFTRHTLQCTLPVCLATFNSWCSQYRSIASFSFLENDLSVYITVRPLKQNDEPVSQPEPMNCRPIIEAHLSCVALCRSYTALRLAPSCWWGVRRGGGVLSLPHEGLIKLRTFSTFLSDCTPLTL
jgi:hypothetical protein